MWTFAVTDAACAEPVVAPERDGRGTGKGAQCGRCPQDCQIATARPFTKYDVTSAESRSRQNFVQQIGRPKGIVLQFWF